MALSSTLTLKLKEILTKTLDISTPGDTLDVDLSDTLADGTGLDQADQIWHDERALSATSTENIDLNGTLTNALGDTVSLARVKALIIWNKNTTAGENLQVGAGSTTFNLFGSLSSRHTIGPNGIFVVWEPSAAAKAVTAGSADLLMIRNANSVVVTYQIIVVGSTA
jgi:hypothetical protein